MGQAGEVLNRPLEVDAASGGLRPKFAGAVSYEDVTFTYAGATSPTCRRNSIPAASSSRS
jgi:ATP-binding cassette subfamily B protein